MEYNNQEIKPMIYDVMFKSVLQSKESEGYLADILSNIINIDKKYIKGNIVFKNSELINKKVNEKGKRTDLLIELGKNIINLEMNKSYYDGLYDKNDGYIGNIKDGLIKKGEKYIKQKKVIQINFDNFEIIDERIIVKFKMIDEERGLLRSNYVYNTDVEIYHVNLHRVQKMYYNKEKLTKFQKELLIMTLDKKDVLQTVVKGSKEMRQVADKISKISREEEMEGIYDYEEQQEYIRKRIKAYAETKGYEEGFSIGEKQGLEQGKKEEHLRYGVGQKKKESDIVIEIVDNTICLEMNKNYKPGIFERNFSYGGMIREYNIQRINDYDNLNRTILINFDNFNRYNDDRSVIKFMMLDKERLIEEGIKYESYHIILPNISKKYYNKNELNKLEKLIEIMNIKEEEKLKEYVKNNKEVRKVAGLIMEISKDEMLRGLYDREEVMEKLNNGAINEGIRKGLEKGIKEGKKEGRKEGIKEGIKEEKLLTAKRMLDNNIDVKTIVISTGLSEKEIQNLKK